jgi:hypothetical protein
LNHASIFSSENSKIEEVEQQKKEDFKPSNLSFLGDLPPLGGGSVGKNLPPVGTGGKNLAPLKKIPLPVAKVEAQKPQQQPKEGKKMSATIFDKYYKMFSWLLIRETKTSSGG